jgi:CRISPR-associated endoribonuclease Cas6
MILKLKLKAIQDDEISLPVHYNRPLQGLFYNLMSKAFPEYHDLGTKVENKKLKLFTFSRIYPENSFKVLEKRLLFKGAFEVYFASPMSKIIDSVNSSIETEEVFRLEKKYFTIEKETINIDEITENMYVKTLSPITAYSTIILPNKSKYTHYYSAYSQDFKKLVEDNIKRKAQAMGENFDDCELNIQPYGITEKNEKLLFYKGIIIKGWTGYFKITGSRELIKLALNSGLGAKNAQGFGMIIPVIIDKKSSLEINFSKENINV